MRIFFWVMTLLPLAVMAQKLQPCQPDAPSLKLEAPLQATGLQIGGVKEFPAGIYRPIGMDDDGTYYLYEKPLTAELMADTVKVTGGLYLPSDPDDDARGWYSMPDGAKNAVIAPEVWTARGRETQPCRLPIPTRRPISPKCAKKWG